MSTRPGSPDGEDPQQKAADAAAARAALLLAADLATRTDHDHDGDSDSDEEQDGSGQASSATSKPATWTPRYPDVQTWVAEMFAVTFVRRATPTFRWCSQWWDHAEALVRLEALWRSWEELRRDPTLGIGTWLREHADHQLPILTGAGGPFADCDPGRHFAPEKSLRLAQAPPGWWGTRSSDVQAGSTPAATPADRTPHGDDVDEVDADEIEPGEIDDVEG